MYDVTIETGFSAAHQLREYRGECENLHGHNWKVRITVSSAELDGTGIAFDFRKLKEQAGKIVKRFDHTNLCDLPEFKHRNPTTENIASAIFELMEAATKQGHARVKEVSVGESDSSWVSFRK